MEIEKRKNPRFVSRKPEEYPVNFGDQKLRSYLSDFSRNGISLKSSGPLEQNKIYHFEIWVTALEKPVTCKAHVMWSRGETNTDHYTSGARILQMDPSSKFDLLDVLYKDWKQKVLINL